MFGVFFQLEVKTQVLALLKARFNMALLRSSFLEQSVLE